MATNREHIDVPPEQVFAILADPFSYGDWVVGSASIRDADAGWPEVASRLHHRVGIGPLKVSDHTEVDEVQAPHRLVLRARARPLGTAVVELILEPRAGGTEVTMKEGPGNRLSHLIINPLTDWLVHLRNEETLRRLKRLAESADGAS